MQDSKESCMLLQQVSLAKGNDNILNNSQASARERYDFLIHALDEIGRRDGFWRARWTHIEKLERSFDEVLQSRTETQDILDFEPDVSVQVDRKAFLKCLKGAPKGPARSRDQSGTGACPIDHLQRTNEGQVHSAQEARRRS